MSPTPAQVRVATSALRREAAVWLDQADVLGHASTQAAALAMTGLESGVFQVLHGAYQQVQAHVTDRCREGRGAMLQVAGTLHGVADTYDLEEARHDHALRHLY